MIKQTNALNKIGDSIETPHYYAELARRIMIQSLEA